MSRPQHCIYILNVVFTCGGKYYFTTHRRPLPPPDGCFRRWSPPPAHVVVAMGTMGGRVHYLVRSLPTLLNQTFPADHVLVSISKYDDMDLMLRQLEQFGPFSNFTPSSDAGDALSHYSSTIRESNTRLNSTTSSLSLSLPILIKG